MMSKDPESIARMGGVDPAKIREAKEFGKHIKAKMQVYNDAVTIQFISDKAEINLTALSSQMAGNIGDFMYNFLGITGERVNAYRAFKPPENRD